MLETLSSFVREKELLLLLDNLEQLLAGAGDRRAARAAPDFTFS